ncbi:MAG: IS200/IS605 family transposase [Ignavibacteria bacterium]|nr:IS200/IS605 family transposase [Ignavibacteria bacterium]
MGTRSRTYSAIYYHFIWATKHRRQILEPDIEEFVRIAITNKGEELGIEIIELNGTLDHVHVLVKSSPLLSPSEIAKFLKGSTSYYVNHVNLRDDPTRRLYWQDGYGVITVSSTGVAKVRSYIGNQKKHHADRSVVGEWEILGID